jgi:membrane protease YdiL (CAAX protease family)
VSPLAPVWNATERRLRAPLRVALTAGVVVAVLVGGSLALSGRSLPDAPATVLVSAALSTVAFVAACAVAAVLFDRRRVRDYGLALDAGWLLDLVAGAALGAVLMTAVLAVSLAAGWAEVTGTLRATGGRSVPAAFGLVLVAFVLVAFGEELIVRGYLLTNLAEGLRALGDRAAVALAVLGSSAVFGGLHATNPNATAVSVAGIALAGVMLGLGFVLTGRLALPVGLHFTWNLFQGPVYGFPVSGIDLGVSLLVLDVTGPAALTGGPFGPEAGLVGAGATAVGTALVVGYARLRAGPSGLVTVLVPDLRWWPWGEDGSGVDPRVARVDDAPGDR